MKSNGKVGPALAKARRVFNRHRQRAKKDGATLDYMVDDLHRLIVQSDLCLHCNTPLSWDVEIDHCTPIARGGSHQLANLVVLCQRCNAMKGMLTEIEFFQLKRLLSALNCAARDDVERRLLAGAAVYGRNRKRRTP